MWRPAEPLAVPAGVASVAVSAGYVDAVLTRPNNVTAYAANQVYGAAANARFSFVVPQPANPSRLRSPNVNNLQFTGIQTANAGGLSGLLHLFTAAPNILGDQAAFDLDAASASVNLPVTNTLNLGTGALLNAGAGLAGRRVAGGLTFTTGNFFAPGDTVWGYFVVGGVYNPLALESLTIRVHVQYSEWVF